MSELKYKLTIYPTLDLDSNSFKEFLFNTAEEMTAAKNTCADLLLFLQDEITVMKDYSNMFIEERFVDGEWEDVDEDDCDSEDDAEEHF